VRKRVFIAVAVAVTFSIVLISINSCTSDTGLDGTNELEPQEISAAIRTIKRWLR